MRRIIRRFLPLILSLQAVFGLSTAAVYSQHSSSYSLPASHPASTPASRPTGGQTGVNRPIGDKWALVVGVGKFQDSGIPTLRFAAKDAQDFANFLIKDEHFAPDHVVVLLNEQATRKQVLTLIGDEFFPRVVKPDDLVVLFYSSHGSPAGKDVAHENFILTYDSEQNNLFATAIDMEDLTRILRERAKADRVLLVMDACHSGGGAAGAKSAGRGANMDVKKLSLGEGQCVISSSSAEQRSWESTRYQNSVFTHQLIEGLRKNPRLEEALKLTSETVADEVQQDQAMEQTPQMNHNKWKGNELVLAVAPTDPRPLPESVKTLLADAKKTAASIGPSNSGAHSGPRSGTQQVTTGHKDYDQPPTASNGVGDGTTTVARPAQSLAMVPSSASMPPLSSAPPAAQATAAASTGLFRPQDGTFAVNMPAPQINGDEGVVYGLKHTYAYDSPMVQYCVVYNEHKGSFDPTALRNEYTKIFLEDPKMLGTTASTPSYFSINGHPACAYWLQYLNVKRGKIVFCATNTRSYAFFAYVPIKSDINLLNPFFNSIWVR